MDGAEWEVSTDAGAMLFQLLGREPAGDQTAWGRMACATDRKLRLFACACAERSNLWKWAHVRSEYARIERGEIPASNTSAGLAGNWARMEAPDNGPSPAVRAALLRDIFNPFRPVTLPMLAAYAHPYRDETVVKLAQAIHDDRRFEDVEGPEILAGTDCPYCSHWPANSPKGENGWVKCKQWRPQPWRGREYAEGELGKCSKCNRVWEPGYDTVAVISKRDTGLLDAARLAVVADALEEAGCTEEELLAHLRGKEWCPKCLAVVTMWAGKQPNQANCWECRGTGWRPLRGPHVRGCWAVDLLLGQE